MEHCHARPGDLNVVGKALLAVIGCAALAGIYGTQFNVYVTTGVHEAGHCFVNQVLDDNPSICRVRLAGPPHPIEVKPNGYIEVGGASMENGVNKYHAWEHPAIHVLEVFVLVGLTLPFALLAVPLLATFSSEQRTFLASPVGA
jgi:hypothetical protein